MNVRWHWQRSVCLYDEDCFVRLNALFKVFCWDIYHLLIWTVNLIYTNLPVEFPPNLRSLAAKDPKAASSFSTVKSGR